MDYFNAIKTKKLEQLSIEEMAFIHLSSQYWGYDIEGGVIKSGLPYLLNEINHVKHQFYAQNFVPVISSFAVLEQLGFCYKRSDLAAYSNDKASGVKKALYYFCNLEDESDDIKALYALRNSLLHNGSLLSQGQNAGSSHYTFVYSRSIKTVVEHAPVAWNGVFRDLDYKTMTTKVNPERLIEITQQAVINAEDALNNGKLDIILADAQMEMYYRFLNFIPSQPHI